MTLTTIGLFSTAGFMPHGMCIAWTPGLLWTLVGSDLVIALSYYSIPVALVWASRQRPGQQFQGMLLMFGAFIFACGTTHLVGVVTVWYPQYWLDAGVKLVTAGVSAATAVLLWPLVTSAARYVRESEEAAEELRDKTELLRELEARNRELNNFVYLASHDLQEPLRTVSAASNLIRSRHRDALDDVGLRSLDFMTEAVQRMSTQIDDLLAHSRLGRAEQEVEVDLREVLASVQEDLSDIIARTSADIEVGPMPVVHGRGRELRVLFQNLLGNALKFRHPDLRPVVRVTAQPADGGWRFEVADNGIGIAPEHRERIFQIFQRLHSRRDYEGTGIGLAHCQKIVETHGGRIWVESVPGEGSTFCFTLPAEAP